FEYRWLSSYGYKIENFGFDTMLAHALLDENAPHNLEDVNSVYIPDFGTYKKNFVAGLGKKQKKNFESADLDKLLLYNAKDVFSTGLLVSVLEKELKKDDKLWWIFNNYTMKNLPMICAMEENGFCVDQKVLSFINNEYTKKIESYEMDMIRKLRQYGF